MKSPTPTLPSARLLRRRALAMFSIASLLCSSAWAVNPPEDAEAAATPDPVVASLVVQDPYFAFLASLDERSASCRHHSTTLRQQLSERELLTRRFASASPTARTQLARAIEELDARIAASETALASESITVPPRDAPGYVAPESPDLTQARNRARRTGRAVAAPPRALVQIPELPAPTHEKLYVEYLRTCAGDSAFAQKLVIRVEDLQRERRELSWRHAHASAEERVALENTIRLVSHQIRASAQAASEGAEMPGW